MEYLSLTPGFRTALKDGVLVPNSPEHMTTEEFYYAQPGDRLWLKTAGYMYAVAEYAPIREDRYIYTFLYQPESNWTVYTKNLDPGSYGEKEYLFEEKCYFRVCVRRKDGRWLDQEDIGKKDELICFSHEQAPIYYQKPWFDEEIKKTIDTVAALTDADVTRICLLADSHVTTNGTWEDTAHNIQSVAAEVNYDAIIHLGDLTDGMLSQKSTRRRVEMIIKDLELTQVPVYITPGNHDTNYFRNGGREFTPGDMKKIYRLGENGNYCVDIAKNRLRMIFLNSFEDKARLRYGYSAETLQWLEKTLADSRPGTRFVIFSHDAPLAHLDYWSCLIQNGEKLVAILERYNAMEQYQVAGLFYGHIHADYIYEECSFPMIAVGCAKLEYFLEKKPKGAVVPYRQADTVTQDLWDSVVIDWKKEKIHLIRFGAGEDRQVSFAWKESTWKSGERNRKGKRDREGKRSVEVWAHRGASGYAPENTLPAFELAYRVGADGIELDVQLTRDGVPVVIHDERIDRVSNGQGRVCDYTLEELKKFNFAKNYPSYCRPEQEDGIIRDHYNGKCGGVEIPTLEEVFDLVKDWDITINIELKNSVIFYKELEEKVLALVGKYQIKDKIIYSSFNHYSLRKLKELEPEARIAFLYSDCILDMDEYAEKYGGYAIHPSLKNIHMHGLCAKQFVDNCHKRGVRVHVWTANEDADIDLLKKLEVDAIITNFVERGIR